MDLNGAVAIVTGGASGIGGQTARLLTDRGARCVILDLPRSEGKTYAAELGATFVAADIADEEGVQNAVETAGELGPIRVLVNAAGIGSAGRTIDRDNEPMPMRRFEKVIRINLLGTFNVLRLTAAAMAKTDPLDGQGQRGAIVNVASVAAYDGQIGQAAYSASKGGILGMTLPIARDLAAVGVRVNTVAPGLIDTPLYGEGEAAERFKAALARNVPFPDRMGVPAEVGSMIVELLANDYMNGETVRVDGGVRLPPK